MLERAARSEVNLTPFLKEESKIMGLQTMNIINERLSYYQNKLGIIEIAMNTEMQKEHRARNYDLLNFLAKERALFRYVSSEVRLIVESMEAVGK